MADVKSRARSILKALPLSPKRRELYERGIAAMDEATLERTTSRLESALSKAPATLAAARKLLESQQAQQRKRVLIMVEDEAYRRDLVDQLSNRLHDKVEIETFEAPQNVIGMIDRMVSIRGVVICDFKMGTIAVWISFDASSRSVHCRYPSSFVRTLLRKRARWPTSERPSIRRRERRPS